MAEQNIHAYAVWEGTDSRAVNLDIFVVLIIHYWIPFAFPNHSRDHFKYGTEPI